MAEQPLGTMEHRSNPLVSVVMAVFNGTRHLREAVEGILFQTLDDFEFIVVDDGSTDSTPTILEEYAANEPRIRLAHNHENLGLTRSLNKGLALAGGEFIARQDADDVSLSSRLERQVAHFHDHPEVGAIGASIDRMDARGHSRSLFIAPTDHETIRAYQLLQGIFCHTSVMARRSLIEAAGGYDDRYRFGQDTDLLWRLGNLALLSAVPEVLVRYRIGEGDSITSRLRPQQLDCGLDISLRILRSQMQEPLDEEAYARFWRSMYGPAIALRRSDVDRLRSLWRFLQAYPKASMVWGPRLLRFAQRLLHRRETLEGLALIRVLRRDFSQSFDQKTIAKDAIRPFVPRIIVHGSRWSRARRKPGAKRKTEVSIGIYEGNSPFDLAPPDAVRNPVLTCRDILDMPAGIVADPFMIVEEDRWYMFFEAFDNDTERGRIGLAVSDNGFEWLYQRVVLDEPFHLSYPYVFIWQGDKYMIPESGATESIRLYRATSFPEEWVFVKSLVEGLPYVDPSVFRFADRWWMFVETSGGRHDTLRLLGAEDLMGPWSEHPRSPLMIGDPKIARPAGRVLVSDGRVFRYSQDCSAHYGSAVRALEVTELTPGRYREREVSAQPVLKASGNGWNSRGMHHIDVHPVEANRWVACVDGFNIVSKAS